MMRNRVLRYFQQPEGVYHGSVFYQLSGGVGPAALAVDSQGSIYVGQYETRGSYGELHQIFVGPTLFLRYAKIVNAFFS